MTDAQAAELLALARRVVASLDRLAADVASLGAAAAQPAPPPTERQRRLAEHLLLQREPLPLARAAPAAPPVEHEEKAP